MIVLQAACLGVLVCVLLYWFTYPFRKAARIDRAMQEWSGGYGKGRNPLDRDVL